MVLIYSRPAANLILGVFFILNYNWIGSLLIGYGCGFFGFGKGGGLES
jgi:hypothetical protein